MAAPAEGYHEAMNQGRRFCETIHITALALWLGGLVMTGVTAAVVFPTMREMDPALPQYAAFTGEHWRLAAGRVAARVFFIFDVMQFVAVLIAGVSFGVAILVYGLPMRRFSTFARGGTLIVLLALLSYQFLVLGPEMNTNMNNYWIAALEGDNGAAERFRQAFEQDHPTATRLMVANTVLVLFSLLAAVWSITDHGEPGGTTLEEPLLAGTRL